MKQDTGHLCAAFLADLAAAILILLVFAFFHLALPHLQTKFDAVTVNEPADEPTAAAAVPIMTQPTAAPEMPKTDWQLRFREHFSQEVIRTDHSYSSPNVSITISPKTFDSGKHTTIYYVADIYIASPECFTAYTANNELVYYETDTIENLAAESNAILSINGDFFAYQSYGLLVRNGAVYSGELPSVDVCALYSDGRIECYERARHLNEIILAKTPVQVWQFGPSLLDTEGHAKEYFAVSAKIFAPNPRTALGYYEPGHYCFLVADGRQDGYSEGLDLTELSRIFEELGCSAAYNLDGGGSSVMYFGEDRINQQSNGGDRSLSDILLIREPEENNR